MGITDGRGIMVGVAVALAAAASFGASYLIWGHERDYFAFRDPAKLAASPENELIQYGFELVMNTPQHIGPEATDASMRYAGNTLACTNCHLNGGWQKYAAPFMSTFASFPMMVSEKAETLADRLNSCMTHSLNGKPLPEDSREMQALIAYIQYTGVGTPEGVRLPGMGLLPVKNPPEQPDAARGAEVYATYCSKCHGTDGQGQPALAGSSDDAIPPLWGDDSFNSTAGMNDIHMASAFIRANMPRGVTWEDPLLSPQQAWDVAAYVTSQPRPVGPGATPAPAATAPAPTPAPAAATAPAAEPATAPAP